MLRAVLFDLDNTLVDRNAAFRDCVETQFSNPAVCAELVQLDHGGRGDRAALFYHWQQQSGSAMNQARFGQLLAEHIRPDHDLIETLRKLAHRLQIGLITNGSSETQRQKIHAAGLAAVFPPDRIWISAEVGSAKPDAAIFLGACRALGVTPTDCLYVGDQEQDDLLGARNAGLRAHRVDSLLTAEKLAQLLDQEVGR